MEDSNNCNTRLKDRSVNAWLLATESPKVRQRRLEPLLEHKTVERTRSVFVHGKYQHLSTRLSDFLVWEPSE